MRTTWDPAVGERYAVWFEAERQASLAAQAVAYDIETGRRWTVADIGSVRSYPAISGDVAVWCSAQAIGVPAINGVRVGERRAVRGRRRQTARRSSPAGLVVWAASWTRAVPAAEIAGGDDAGPWRPASRAAGSPGIALAGRTLVWGQASETAGLRRGGRRRRGRRRDARRSPPASPASPARRTTGGRSCGREKTAPRQPASMGRRLGGGPPSSIADGRRHGHRGRRQRRHRRLDRVLRRRRPAS